MSFFSYVVTMALDGAKFASGIKRAQSVTEAFSKSAKRQFSAVGSQLAAAFSVGAVTAFGKSVIDAADRIGDLAEQMGLTTDEVQKLEILSKKTGTELEAMGQLFVKVGEYRQKAGEGDRDAQANLQRMGVSMAMVNDRALTNKDLAIEIGRAYGKSAKTAAEQNVLADIAGAKAVKLLAVIQQIDSIGPVDIISAEQIQELGQFADDLDEITRQMKVAAAPAVGFWGRVLKGANEDPSSKSGVNFSLTKSIFKELFGGTAGGVDTSALPVPSKAERDAAKKEAASPLYTPKTEAEKAAGIKAGSPASMAPEGSSLNKMGGFYFDSVAARDVQRDQLQKLIAIAQNTKKAADIAESNQ